MRPWRSDLDGEFRGYQSLLEAQGRPRIVFDDADGTHHGYDLGSGGQIGALLSGPGANESGATVGELLSPARLAARATAASAANTEKTQAQADMADIAALLAAINARGAAATVTEKGLRAIIKRLSLG